MCYPRIRAGRVPACVEACPEKATIFGPRDELLREAHRRIQENPERYIHSVVGETEVGGTSVLYISDIPLGFLGYTPNMGNRPLPALTWSALSKVPPIVVGMGGLMTGIYWVIERRMRLSAEKARHPESLDEKRNEP
jgi:formate dehydrogenase iron-sulfur subunit